MYIWSRMSCLLAFISLILMFGCERYAVTLNEHPVYAPEPIYSGYQIDDPGFRNCVKQALVDGKIKQPEALRILNCSYAGVTQIAGIEVFSKLTRLNLSNNQLTDIEPLLFLGDLEQVNLGDNPHLNCDQVKILETLLPPPGTIMSRCD